MSNKPNIVTPVFSVTILTEQVFDFHPTQTQPVDTHAKQLVTQICINYHWAINTADASFFLWTSIKAGAEMNTEKLAEFKRKENFKISKACNHVCRLVLNKSRD